MQKSMLALLALVPLVIARRPWQARKAEPNNKSHNRHAEAVRELAQAMREAEMPAALPQLRLVAVNG